MKKTRILLMILLSAVLCFVAVSCKKNVGTPEDNANVEDTEEEEKDSVKEEETEELVIGFSVPDMSNPFYVTLENSVKEEADKKGYKLITKDPAKSQDAQISQISEMIKEGIDVMILSPVNYEKVTPALEALSDAKIKVVNVDSRVKDHKYTEAFVGSDTEYAGKICGEKLIEDMPEGGKVAILECNSRSSIMDIITSFEETISKAEKGFEIVDRRNAECDKDEGYNQAKTILQENSDIDAFMCGSDAMAVGALKAVQELNKEGSVKIYSIDGSPEVKALINQENSSIVATVALSPINIGKSVFKVMEDIVADGSYESEVKESVYLITKENVEVYGADGWQ